MAKEVQNPPYIESWFGVDDLLLSGINATNQSNNVKMNISQIVENKVQSFDFFTIHGISYVVNHGAWHLTADNNEKRKLTCLFEKSKPECI
jgi:hypothetical protein